MNPNLELIYYWVGLVVTWILIAAIIIAVVGFTVNAIWYLIVKKIWMHDWFAYNIRRVTIPTEKLREGYAYFKMNAYWRRYTAKYRLRNIKKLRKS